MIPNSQTPLVTILMPFYNAGKGFEAALHSILSQTYENWELLLCDDGSTDGSLSVARSIRDERVITWSDGTRKGLAGRLNECIDRARGEFIARMDADDISYPERFLKQVEFLLAHPETDLVGCQMLIFGEDGSPFGQRRVPQNHEGIVARPYLGFGLAHPTWMARAAWFRKYRYDPAALRYEDAELLYRSHENSRFANLPEILYGYREMRGGVWKRLQTRMGRIRYLKTHSASKNAMYFRAAAAEAVKTVFDAALVATSARYAWLRVREQRLGPEQADGWRKVFDLANGTSPQVSPANPLRLLVMTTVPETIESFFQRQIGLLSQSGFEVHTVCAPGRPLPGLKNLPDVKTYRVPMGRRPDPWRDAVSLLRLFRLIRRLRPDILHAHTPKAGLLGMMAARAAGVQVRLYTIHGLPLMTRKGVWRRVLALAERTSCGLATRVYSVSPSLETVATEMSLCRADKVSTIGDGSCAGIDVERFRSSDDVRKRAAALRLACGIPEDALVLSFVGRIARDKGIAILASAWSRLAGQFPHVHLLLAGVEDSSDRVPESALRELRNHDRVHFTDDWVADMPALYAATDIVVLPTFREGLPQVALEAGAMGVPIVSTRVPGVVNSVQDGVTGLLVPAGESAPLADAVRRLIEDATLRAALGSAACDYVRAHFSEQRVNQLWISEYRKLVSQALPGFVNRLTHVETSR
jgi:glycosyltransferase involved in cell wall biosynthesis